MRDKYLDRPCVCTACDGQPERFWRDALVLTAACFTGFVAAALFLWFCFVAVWPW